MERINSNKINSVVFSPQQRDVNAKKACIKEVNINNTNEGLSLLGIYNKSFVKQNNRIRASGESSHNKASEIKNFHTELSRIEREYGKNYPICNDKTSIKSHHEVHGNNSAIRECSRILSKFTLKELEAINYAKENIQSLKKWFEIPDDDSEDEYVSFPRLAKYMNSSDEKLKEGCIALKKLSSKEKETYRYVSNIISELNKEFDELPELEQDCIFHRSTSANMFGYDGDYEIIKAAEVGDIIQPDKGCSYTSFLDAAMPDYCNNDKTKAMHIKVLAPKGAKISRNKEHGGEALFPMNAKYRVLSKQVEPDGLITAFIEYILPDD